MKSTQELVSMRYFLIAIITVMSLVGCGGAEDRKAVYLEKAKLSLEAGDLDKARIELKNVLQIDPKDAQAYFQLGDILDQKEEYRKAFGKYSKAVELAPENLEYHAKVGYYLLIMAGDIDAAIKKRDFILGKDATNINGLLLNAYILYKQNEVVAAKKITQDIFSRRPGYIQNAIFLSSLYLRDKEYEASINVLNACIKENPNDHSLANMLASTYLKAGKHDLAEKQYMQILKKNPEVFSNYLKLALFYKYIKNSDKAENILRKAIKKDDNDVKRMVALVDIIQQIKGNLSAIEELKNLIRNYSEMGELRLNLAKLYLAEKNQDDAEKTLTAAISDFSEDSVGIKSRVYLANLYMKNGNVESAINIINDAIKISPNDSEVNFVNAKILLSNKDFDGAIISLRPVVKDDPENIEAYFLLSMAHMANGEEEQANEIIFRAYENNRTNAKGLMALARYHSKNKNNSELEKIIDNYLSIDANNYEALSFKSKVLNEREMFSEVKPYVSRMIELYPDMPNGYVQSVPYLLSEDRVSEAISLLEDGYKMVKENHRILEPLVTLYVSTKDFEVATNKVQSAIRDNVEAVELYMLLAKIQIASGNEDAAKSSLSNAGLKNDLELLMELAKLYSEHGDYNKAINVYEKAYEKYGDKIVLINNLASLLSQYRSDEKSLKRAKELADKIKNVDQAVVLDTVGWVYYKIGDYTEAVNVLKTVVEKSPYEAIFNYHLGMALYKNGDEIGAKTYLTNSLTNKTSFAGKSDAEAHLQKLQ